MTPHDAELVHKACIARIEQAVAHFRGAVWAAQAIGDDDAERFSRCLEGLELALGLVSGEETLAGLYKDNRITHVAWSCDPKTGDFLFIFADGKRQLRISRDADAAGISWLALPENMRLDDLPFGRGDTPLEAAKSWLIRARTHNGARMALDAELRDLPGVDL